ncbi:MAG: hypothetical protein ACTSPV_16515, partial [Candidatus Hodarchaeales archaeon]
SFEDTFYLQMTNYHFKSFDLSQSLPISPSHSYGKTVYLYRIMLFKSWEGKIRISLEISDIGKRTLQLVDHDIFSRLEREYRLPQDTDRIYQSFEGDFEENPQWELTLDNTAVRLAKEVLEYICRSFGFSPEFDFDIYISGILYLLARRGGNFTTAIKNSHFQLPCLNLPVERLRIPAWAK